jgi:hypothetical protein
MKKMLFALLMPAVFIFSQANAQNQPAQNTGKPEVKAKVNGVFPVQLNSTCQTTETNR